VRDCEEKGTTGEDTEDRDRGEKTEEEGVGVWPDTNQMTYIQLITVIFEYTWFQRYFFII